MNEKDKSGREKIGRKILYGGIIAGVIGIIAAPELVFVGAGLATAGVIFESTGSKKGA